MSGYTVTLTDSEYDALKARIARLEAALRKIHGAPSSHSDYEDEWDLVMDMANTAHEALCYCDGLPQGNTHEVAK
jgi:hypothetical protein